MLAVSDLAFTHPGAVGGFSDVSFRVPRGTTAALVGINGVGKTTVVRLLAGELTPDDGSTDTPGSVRYMPQEVGFDGDTGSRSLRRLLGRFAPAPLDAINAVLCDAEEALEAGDDMAGVALGEHLARWGELGGYGLEARWDAACRRVLGAGFDEVAARDATTLSGGERKGLVLAVLLGAPGIDTLLLDEPDNYLDVPGKLWLEGAIRASRQTILLISHDRELLAGAPDRIVTLEAGGAWVHHGAYDTYEQARADRQERMGDALQRWQDEERRLYRYFKLLKERARYYDSFAPKAKAAETRWRHWVEAGPPPAPVSDQHVAVRLPGGASGRRMLKLDDIAVEGLIQPLSADVRVGDRIGMIGPNGSGKTHLVRVLAGDLADHHGVRVEGDAVRVGYFAQVSEHPGDEGQVPFDVAMEATGNRERSMAALARYGLGPAARQPWATLSGGQKARLAIMALELAGVNLLLLDEPTDNLDVDSAVALEAALEGFDGAVVSVSHDRAHLRTLDTFWHVDTDGAVREVLSVDEALAVLRDGIGAVHASAVRPLRRP